jgi:hypothetical protein
MHRIASAGVGRCYSSSSKTRLGRVWTMCGRRPWQASCPLAWLFECLELEPKAKGFIPDWFGRGRGGGAGEEAGWGARHHRAPKWHDPDRCSGCHVGSSTQPNSFQSECAGFLLPDFRLLDAWGQLVLISSGIHSEQFTRFFFPFSHLITSPVLCYCDSCA